MNSKEISDNKPLKDKLALITGSTSGIGLGIAEKLASQGASLVINGFSDSENIEKIKNHLISLGAKQVVHIASDLSKPDQILKMFEEIEKAKWSHKHHNDTYCIDILVNNAGIQHVSPIENFPDEKWEAIIRLDLVSSFYTIKHTVPFMKKNKWGRIINIASAHGLVASPYKSAYVAAKHGILGLTKTVALELAEHGITVNAICPGYVKTPLVLGQIKDTALSRGITEDEVIKNVILGAQATKQFVEIDEVAELVSYLCSDKAKSITGAALSIDGGWTAH